MKKLIVAVVFVAIFAAGLPVFAQSKQNESEFYYVNVSVERIYFHRNGYIIQYRKGSHQLARAYLPLEWFAGVANKGEIVSLPGGRGWPSLTVYYKNGEFSHVRLYVHPLNSHQTWGSVPQNVNLDSNFENIEDIKLSF